MPLSGWGIITQLGLLVFPGFLKKSSALQRV